MSEADPKLGPPKPEQLDHRVRTESGSAWPRRRLLIMLSVPLLLLIAGAYFWLTSGRYVSTDDAYVEQHMVTVAPEVGGRVIQTFVRENQMVRRGQLLFRIDPRPYRIALEQAEAQIADAEVQVNQLKTRQVTTLPDIAGALANLTTTQRTFDRQAALLQQGFTTRSNYEAALQTVQEARQRLNDARGQSALADASLRQGGPSNQPAVMAAEAARDQALLNLARIDVRAPAGGRISQSDNLQVGATAAIAVPLVTIVRDGTTYVEANYKETDLKNMRVGQPATIKLDAYSGVRFAGRVQSIGAGTGSQFSLLPPQNATGNWVKVTQRVPVRIAIDANNGRLMIAGLSATVTVDTGNGR